MTTAAANAIRWESLVATPMPCRVARLTALPEPFGSTIAALLDRDLSHVQVALRVKQAGYAVSDVTIGRHRRKICTCYFNSDNYGAA